MVLLNSQTKTLWKLAAIMAVSLMSSHSNAATVSGGFTHSCAVTDGVLHCWGSNKNGELGTSDYQDSYTPVAVDIAPVLDGSAEVIEVASGNSHSCALLADNSVRCWGKNNNGQIAQPLTTPKNATPTEINLPPAQQIAAGANHNCALLTDGRVSCWGSNSQDQTAVFGAQTVTTPQVVPGLFGVAQIALGGQHSCALLQSGFVKCWGLNYFGQLGQGYSNLSLYSPKFVVGADGLGSFLRNVQEISLGADHSCALLADSSVQCWGKNTSGQLGNDVVGQEKSTIPVAVIDAYSPYTGDPSNPRGPLQSVQSITAGGYFSSAILTDGSVRVWGNNSKGELAWDGGPNQWSNAIHLRQDFQTLSGIESMAAGVFHACLIDSQAQLNCWGSNENGQLGLGYSSSPIYNPSALLP